MAELRRIALMAACAVLVGCGSGRSASTAGPERLPTTVLVDNQSFMDMTVYVLRGGQRVRLGTATAVARSRFTIPQGIIFGLETLRFLADPIGSNRRPVSEEITVREGDEVVLRIPPV